MPADQLTLKFKCRCGEHEFGVRYREGTEGIVRWMEVVRVEMGRAHQRISPLCPSPHLRPHDPVQRGVLRRRAADGALRCCQ